MAAAVCASLVSAEMEYRRFGSRVSHDELSVLSGQLLTIPSTPASRTVVFDTGPVTPFAKSDKYVTFIRRGRIALEDKTLGHRRNHALRISSPDIMRFDKFATCDIYCIYVCVCTHQERSSAPLNYLTIPYQDDDIIHFSR